MLKGKERQAPQDCKNRECGTCLVRRECGQCAGRPSSRGSGKILFQSALLLLLLTTLLCGSAFADTILKRDTEAMLPDGVHLLTLPAGMVSQLPASDETDLKGIFLREPDLEMLVFAYPAQGATAQSLAEALTEAGRTAEVREIAGEAFLVYQDVDEEDGTPCVGYSYLYRDWIIEISFFYSSQEAADLTTTIMESFH